ncbi:cofactor-independent phosphoglycerate mutase [Chitinispirillum alkaliphilum]|nr:cofactor-independent phosphoglycerate mutase [Chitinispirillum alkaliphilum]
MADFPIPELGNRTPLEAASTPNMDKVVSRGHTGLVSTVPEGLAPGSDVANMSLLGYDPQMYYSGRAPIEAASMGITLEAEDIAFRCNLVTLKNGIMEDYSAGHIETLDGAEIVTELQQKLGNEKVHFYPGVSYRHLMVLKGLRAELDCTPPHDISGKEYAGYLPKGKGSDFVIDIMERAREILANSPINKKRVESGKMPATDIWLWGEGSALTLPTLREIFSLSGSVISAVDLVRGLGKLAGLKVRIVEGATGYLGTNYAGKVAAAKDALKEEDFVYLHVEAPDETSHEGSLEKKIQAIEEFDTFVVGEMLKLQDELGNLKILVLPDHATPVSLRTHSEGPVPYGACGTGIRVDQCEFYNEKVAQSCSAISGPALFRAFIQGTL